MDFYHFVVILAKNDMKDMSDFDNKFCKKRLASVHCNPIHFCCFVGKKNCRGRFFTCVFILARKCWQECEHHWLQIFKKN
jgi:hypothetical protein